ncbi:MAG: hypothetical protein H0X43_10740 [Nitrosospira sp.]|nr:hypothetical protein [Nitrosospira sp.]
MIDTFTRTFQNKAPELKHVRYDFKRREFIGRDGLPIHREVFKRSTREGAGRAGRAGRAGEATTHPGILIQSLLSSSSGERTGIIERVLDRRVHLF